jgi:hypothetical protein
MLQGQNAIVPIPDNGNWPGMDHLEPLREKLAQFKQEHRDLDSVIARLEEHFPRDELQLRRLKKRKLQLKDEIVKIEGILIPDIIA